MDALGFLVSLEHDSRRYSASDGSRVAGDFTVVDAKARYEVIKNLTAEIGLHNLFDADYEYEEGYPEPGRTVFANIRYAFN